MRIAWILVAVLCGGCALGHLSPTSKLNQSVREANDAARWGRLDLAVQYVHPAYRDQFLAHRRYWGRDIQVGDADLVRMDMPPDDDDRPATALVAVSWYRLNQMALRQTVLRQVWKEYDGNFLLASEDVVDGDAFLLTPPAPDALSQAGHGIESASVGETDL